MQQWQPYLCFAPAQRIPPCKFHNDRNDRFLMAFAVIGANASFALRADTRAVLDRDIPFDALYIEEQSDTDNQYSPISVDEGEKMIEKYAKLSKDFPLRSIRRAEMICTTVQNGPGKTICS